MSNVKTQMWEISYNLLKKSHPDAIGIIEEALNEGMSATAISKIIDSMIPDGKVTGHVFAQAALYIEAERKAA